MKSNSGSWGKGGKGSGCAQWGFGPQGGIYTTGVENAGGSVALAGVAIPDCAVGNDGALVHNHDRVLYAEACDGWVLCSHGGGAVFEVAPASDARVLVNDASDKNGPSPNPERDSCDRLVRASCRRRGCERLLLLLLRFVHFRTDDDGFGDARAGSDDCARADDAVVQDRVLPHLAPLREESAVNFAAADGGGRQVAAPRHERLFRVVQELHRAPAVGEADVGAVIVAERAHILEEGRPRGVEAGADVRKDSLAAADRVRDDVAAELERCADGGLPFLVVGVHRDEVSFLREELDQRFALEDVSPEREREGFVVEEDVARFVVEVLVVAVEKVGDAGADVLVLRRVAARVEATDALEVFGLLLPRLDAPVVADVHHSAAVRLRSGADHRGDRDIGILRSVLGDELRKVEAVEPFAGEDDVILDWRLVGARGVHRTRAQVLAHGVGRPERPLRRVCGLVGAEDVHKALAPHGSHVALAVRLGDVLQQLVRVPLCQHKHLAHP
mmetsp:Transcript_4788/g.16491  ORF Transcript_4788/g.16491 Transcript_4788/m.16491 type:complete len:501 (-) Transcript_4788:518-2020(-)